ncbi:MAG TPA: hypothetical protein DCR94_03250 [Firmicutes bacterium]|nr:hypothetical protein [Bacillota bacterium]
MQVKKNKHVRTLLSRISGGGLLFLSNISLISIGFSAWSIGETASAEAQIKVGAADVIDLQNIFQIQTPEIFQYSPYGIVQDETFVSNGNIFFPLIINTSDEGFSRLLSSDNTLSFDFEIVNTGTFGIFNDGYLEKSEDGTYNAFYSFDKEGFSSNFTSSVKCNISNQTATTRFAIGNTDGLFESGRIYFKIRLGFSFSDYERNVYPKLSASGLSLSINVKAVAA